MKEKLKKIFTSESTEDKSLGFIINAFYKATKSKMNYIRFKISQEDIKKINPDKPTAIKSTYMALSAIGFDKTKLLASLNEYKFILSNEKKAFDTALEKQMQIRVLSKQQNIEKFKDAIENCNQEILKLQKKIETYKKNISMADSDAQNAEKKIQQQGLDFNKTYNSVLQNIDEDLNNYNNLL